MQDGGGKLSCDRVGGRGFVWKSLQGPAEIHWSGLLQLPDDNHCPFSWFWYPIFMNGFVVYLIYEYLDSYCCPLRGMCCNIKNVEMQTVAMKFILKHGKSDKDIENLRQEIEVSTH